MRKCGLASLAFFYHDFREDQKRDLRGLLSSVLFQFCDQSGSYYDILSKFYSTHRSGVENPSDDARPLFGGNTETPRTSPDFLDRGRIR